MLQPVGITEAPNKFGEIVDLVRYRGEPVVLIKSGKPAAEIVLIEWLERYRKDRATNTSASLFDSTSFSVRSPTPCCMAVGSRLEWPLTRVEGRPGQWLGLTSYLSTRTTS
jgi:prevent-host-death family protein